MEAVVSTVHVLQFHIRFPELLALARASAGWYKICKGYFKFSAWRFQWIVARERPGFTDSEDEESAETI